MLRKGLSSTSLSGGALVLPPAVSEESVTSGASKRKRAAMGIKKVWKAMDGQDRPWLACCLTVEKRWYDVILEGTKCSWERGAWLAKLW